MRKHIKKHAGDIVCDVVLYGALIVLALVCFLPMWHVLMAAISDPSELYVNNDFLFLPIGGVSFETWKIVFDGYPILRGYLNTIIYTLLSTLIGLVLSILAAYVLSRKNAMLKGPLFIFLLVPMFVSGGMIPLYMVVYSLDLTGTMWSIVLPTCCNALNIFLVRNGIAGIDDAYVEAAELDGAGHITILFKIIIPLIVPYISVIIMYSIIGQWNAWMLPKIFLGADQVELYPLSLVTYNLLQLSGSTNIQGGLNMLEEYNKSIQMVVILVSSLPLILIYPFVQKHFEKATIIGGLKG